MKDKARWGVAVCATAAVAIAAGCGGGGGTEQTITLKEGKGDFNFSDAAPKAKGEGDYSPGDSFTLNTEVTRDGTAAGKLNVVCVSTAAEQLQGPPENSVCAGTFVLDDGTVAVTGTPVPGENDEFDIAVTGGTGSYAGATGTLTTTDANQSTDTLHLTIPD